MRTILFLFLMSLNLFSAPEIWINQGAPVEEFKSYVYGEDGISIADYYLALFEKRSVDQTLLLSKADFWSKTRPPSAVLDTEIQDLQKTYIFSASNRLVLFEFFKQNAPGAKSLCYLYANDSYLKTSEPFFDSNCGLSRISIADINSEFLKFDYLLIDGNRIDIRQSPYFFSSGQTHQFIFISDKYVTKEISSTVKLLKKTTLLLEPWVESTCDEVTKNNTALSDAVKIYFSKDCIQNAKPSTSGVVAFVSRNKYYILSGLLISLVALYASSQYELGVTLH